MSLAKDLSFGLPFFYRVVLPGVLLATVSAPILAQLFRLLGITTAETQTQLTAVYALIVGFVLTALDDPIYQFYEGRHGWPPPLSRALTALWRRRVDAMQRRADAAKRCGDTAAYDELWSEIRQFPADEHDHYIATRPTKMGNILASYEDYPDSRYGMDSVFYWYRLWLRVDKDIREEVDRTWASTDALMYLAAGSAALGVVYLVLAAVAVVTSVLGSPWLLSSESERALFALWGGTLMLLSYVPYRLSISGHLQNGELYKSLFDLYRAKLKPDLAAATPAERETWSTTWAALQYGIDEPTKSVSMVSRREIGSAIVGAVILVLAAGTAKAITALVAKLPPRRRTR